jgi:hypothetical protein
MSKGLVPGRVFSDLENKMWGSLVEGPECRWTTLGDVESINGCVWKGIVPKSAASLGKTPTSKTLSASTREDVHKAVNCGFVCAVSGASGADPAEAGKGGLP